MDPALPKPSVRAIVLAVLLLAAPLAVLTVLPGALSAGPSFLEVAAHHRPGARFDASGRLVAFDGKTTVPCPAQTDRTAVLLVAGQSNAANHAQHRYASHYGARIVGFFDGVCTIAQSPLLGASGEWGEIWTPLANRLIASGAYDQVVLVPAAIGGSSAAQWTRGGSLHSVLTDAVAEAQASGYRFTQVLWYQGESDYFAQTPASKYRADLSDIFGSIRAARVRAPIYVAVATRCKAIAPQWTRDNPIAHIQRTVAQVDPSVHAGIDADAIIGEADRYDNCHLAPSGVEKAVASWINVLNPRHAHRQD